MASGRLTGVFNVATVFINGLCHKCSRLTLQCYCLCNGAVADFIETTLPMAVTKVDEGKLVGIVMDTARLGM
jgi:hypothetical protein